MNKFGAVIFILCSLFSGAFLLVGPTGSDAEYIAAEARITDETTYEERYSSYFTCTADIKFVYTATMTGSTVKSYPGSAIGTIESGQSCIEEIEFTYSIDSTLMVFYQSDEPETYTFDQPNIGDSILYLCCSFVFAIFALFGLLVAFMTGTQGTSGGTGGLAGRLRASLGGKSEQIKGTSTGSFPTLPSQQHVSRNKKSSKRRKCWKDGTMPPSRIRNYDSIINRMGLNNRGFSNVKEAKAHAMTYGIMSHNETDEFFANDHVLRTLGLSNASAFNSTPAPKSSGFWGQAKISTSSTQTSDETCGHPGCSTTVNTFDFRCFDCRKRFCSTHRGETFQCDSCAN